MAEIVSTSVERKQNREQRLSGVKEHHGDRSAFLKTNEAETARASKVALDPGQRSFLPILVEGAPVNTLPDTGASHNVITEAYAASIGVTIDRNPCKQCVFTNAVGRKFRSSGTAELNVALSEDPQKILKTRFAVVKRYAEPFVLGDPFLSENEIFTKVDYSHCLVKGPSSCALSASSKRMFRLMHMDQPRQKLACTVDTEPVLANADTGSELDVVSLRYTRSRGWAIEPFRQHERCHVMLVDKEIVQLAGYLQAKLLVDGNEMVKRFHVLNDLVYDIILGDATPGALDAFKKCQNALVRLGRRQKSFCVILWKERLSQLEANVDNLLLGGQSSSQGSSQKRGRLSSLLSLFSSNTGDHQTTDANSLGLQLRHRLDEVDHIETECNALMAKKMASLRGSELVKEQEIDRQRKDRHAQLHDKIVKHIKDLSAGE